jgi:hypothetical protein
LCKSQNAFVAFFLRNNYAAIARPLRRIFFIAMAHPEQTFILKTSTSLPLII